MLNLDKKQNLMENLSFSFFGQTHKVSPLAPMAKSKSLSSLTRQRVNLGNIFSRLNEGKDIHVVCLPSLTLDQEDIKSVLGFKHYETRSLWQLLMAGHPQIYVTFITSVDIDDFIIDYFIDLLPNSSEARKRVRILKVQANSEENNSLIEDLLQDEKTMSKLTSLVDCDNSFLLSFLSSQYENQLADKLNIPLWGCLDQLEHYQTKSGNREIFQEAFVSFADGYNNLYTETELVEAIINLKEKHPGSQRFVVKLNHGVSGDGNAILHFEDNFADLTSDEQRAESIWRQLEKMSFQAEGMDWGMFKKKLSSGAIVELFLEGENKTSPSVQGRIHPDGTVEIISTHEQILDTKGMKYLGCRFPAKSEFRTFITHQAYKIGKKMRDKGVLGYFAVDFLVATKAYKKECHAIEINIRQGGTTHPYQTAKLLTGATYYNSTGLLLDTNGLPVYYLSNDNLILKNDASKNAEAFISFMKDNGIVFDRESSRGVVFHLLSALEEYGKVGYTVISNGHEEAKAISDKIIALTHQFYLKSA